MSDTFYKPDKISNLYAPNKLVFGIGSASQAGKEASYIDLLASGPLSRSACLWTRLT